MMLKKCCESEIFKKSTTAHGEIPIFPDFPNFAQKFPKKIPNWDHDIISNNLISKTLYHTSPETPKS